jgi:hypothetical protein
MAVRAASFKNWCTENISPQSWARILLKSMHDVRAQGMTIKELENPEDSVELNPELLESLNRSLEEIYQTQVQEELLSTY